MEARWAKSVSRPGRGNGKESFSSNQETGKVFSPEMPFYSKFKKILNTWSPHHLHLPLMRHPAMLKTIPIPANYIIIIIYYGPPSHPPPPPPRIAKHALIFHIGAHIRKTVGYIFPLLYKIICSVMRSYCPENLVTLDSN